MKRRELVVCAGVVASSLAGCLPIDTSPLAEVSVKLRASELSGGIPSTEMSDGWEISFERSLLTIHSAGLVSTEGTECASSTIADYERVLSLKEGRAQKVALLFARGACGFEYMIGPPFEPIDLVLGTGVSRSDLDAMLEAVSNATIAFPGLFPGRAEFRKFPGFYVEGSAHKGDTEKRFQWVFGDLPPEPESACPASRHPGLHLSTGEKADVEILAHGEALFADSSQGGALSFSRFADADADADGFISMAELLHAESPDADTDSLYEHVVSELLAAFTSPSDGLVCL